MFDIIDQNKNGNIEYREFVAATIRKTLFKDLVYDEENIEVANIKEVDADFQDDVDMQDDGPMNQNQRTRTQTMGSGLTGMTGMGSNPFGSPVDSMASKQAECYLSQAFRFFDQDNTGYITKENIKSILT